MEVCIGRNRISNAKVGPPSQQGAPLDLTPSHCDFIWSLVIRVVFPPLLFPTNMPLFSIKLYSMQ